MASEGDGGDRPRDAASATRRRGFPWSRVLFAGSIALMVAGASLMAYGAIRGEPEVAASSGPAAPSAGGAAEGPGGLPLGLLPTDPSAPPGAPFPAPIPAPVPAEGADRPIDVWSPTIFRLGFSFFAGFSIAYAVRTFFKLSVLAAGVAILGLFGLQYAGVIDVDWDAISGHWDSISGWLGEQTASFGEFVRGYLPSAGSAALGFAMGFRRR